MRQRGGFSSRRKVPASSRSWRVDSSSGIRGGLDPPNAFNFFCGSLGFLEALVRKLSSPAAAHTQNAARCVIKPQPSRREKTVNKATVPRRGCLKPKTSAAEQRLAVFK